MILEFLTFLIMALLEVEQLSKRFIEHVGLFRKQDFYAVKAVSFTLNKRETLAVIGDNGAGKSTLANMAIVTFGLKEFVWYSRI